MTLEQQVYEVIAHYKGLNDIDVSFLLDQWRSNKESLKKFFGIPDSLIYEYPEKITLYLSEEEKTRLSNDFFEKWNLDYIAPYVNLFNNVFTEDYGDIKAGTKFIRKIPYLLDDPCDIEDCANEASRLIQRIKVSGTFCLSIHPLDYLSLSENNCNWRSCHALDGEYSTGNLQYMTDASTIVCYIKEDSLEKLPRFPETVPWNSKKWRMLLFAANDRTMIFAGRQYPFQTNSIFPLLLKIFPFPTTSWLDWRIGEETNPQGIYIGPTYYPVSGELKASTDLIRQPNNPLLYNDVLFSTKYTPSYLYTGAASPKFCGNTHPSTVFYIGHDVLCLRCGRHYIYDSSAVLCNNCLEEEKGD